MGRRWLFLVAAATLALLCGTARAQEPARLVLLSDVHFDPFSTPARLSALRAAPVERWPALLSAAAPAADASQSVAAGKDACGAGGEDTGWPLLQRSLQAAHQAQPRPALVTVGGDLLAHGFPCRFAQLAPGSTPEEAATFAAKTFAFVLWELRSTFPRTPVFATLGNNDSGCGDYRESVGSPFLAAARTALAQAAGVPAAALTPEADYSAALPLPFRDARLVVLSDAFASRLFRTCAGAADHDVERQQLDWLGGQLSAARARGEHVWVMAHLPTGVDVLRSFRGFVLRPAQLCSATPEPYLASTALADTLLDFADVVQLVLFGHTHMDELRLLHRGDAALPAKLVPSISPFAGNHPAFLVGTADPATATLLDWETVVSPQSTGSPAPWTRAYGFRELYHLPDVSGRSVETLAAGFAADHDGRAPRSEAYRRNLSPGDLGLFALGLGQIWPAYACAVQENRPSAVKGCLCAAKPLPPPAP